MSDIESEIAHLYSWIRGVACRISCDVMDGEDLAHDTIIKALLNASRFHAGRDLKPWLMAIMANTYKSKMRHVAKIPFCPLQDEWTIIYRSDPDDRITCKSIVSLMQTDCRLRSLWLYVCGYSCHDWHQHWHRQKQDLLCPQAVEVTIWSLKCQ